MTESRYGVRVGRPPKGGTAGIRRAIRLDPAIDAQVEAFRVREGLASYTLALEGLLQRGLRGLEEGDDNGR